MHHFDHDAYAAKSFPTAYYIYFPTSAIINMFSMGFATNTFEEMLHLCVCIFVFVDKLPAIVTRKHGKPLDSNVCFTLSCAVYFPACECCFLPAPFARNLSNTI